MNYRDPEWLYEKYHEEGMSMPEMAELEDVTAPTIHNYMKEHDIETRGPGGFEKCDPSREWLYKKYCQERLSSHEIGDILGVSHPTVLRRLEEHDIERRNPGASPKVGYDR